MSATERPTCETCPYWQGPGNGNCRRLNAEDRVVHHAHDWCGQHPDFPAWLEAQRPNPYREEFKKWYGPDSPLRPKEEGPRPSDLRRKVEAGKKQEPLFESAAPEEPEADRIRSTEFDNCTYVEPEAEKVLTVSEVETLRKRRGNRRPLLDCGDYNKVCAVCGWVTGWSAKSVHDDYADHTAAWVRVVPDPPEEEAVKVEPMTIERDTEASDPFREELKRRIDAIPDERRAMARAMIAAFDAARPTLPAPDPEPSGEKPTPIYGHVETVPPVRFGDGSQGKQTYYLLDGYTHQDVERLVEAARLLLSSWQPCKLERCDLRADVHNALAAFRREQEGGGS